MGRRMRVSGAAFPPQYTIYQQGTTFVAEPSKETGFPWHTGAVFAVVAQAALGSLTAGRTWKEKIVVKGHFTTTDTINLPSYTIWELQGSITLGAPNLNRPILQNEDVTDGNHNIEIRGGYYNGNKANQNGVFSNIRLVRCVDVIVEGIESVYAYHPLGADPIDPAWGAGLLICGGYRILVTNSTFIENGYCGIGLVRITIALTDYDPHHVRVIANHTMGNGVGMNAGSNGGGIRTNNLSYSTISENVCVGDYAVGINVRDNNMYSVCNSNIIRGDGVTDIGINLTNNPLYCSCVGNAIDETTYYAIRLNGALRCSVVGNVIDDPGTIAGIYIYSASHYNVVANNTMRCRYAVGGQGIFLDTSDSNIVIGNNVVEAAQYNIFIDDDSDFNNIWSNFTAGGGVGECCVNNANCNINHILGNDFNTIAVVDNGTGTVLTRPNWDNM